MCNACQVTVDPEGVDAFGGKLLDVINHAGVAMMISVGHRTGIFDTMATIKSATSHRIAEEAALNERYVRECLGALVTGGIVEYDSTDKTYALPAEHAALLTRAASPNNFASTMQWVSVLGEVENQIVDCFAKGSGVPYSAYSRFHEVMAEESAQTVVAGLLEHIIPLCEGLEASLKQGIDVLDIGCGSGQAMVFLAKSFPNSRFVGYDLSQEAVTAANEEVARLGLANVRFEAKNVADLTEEGSFDLITAFDAIHDQADPAKVLEGISHALRPDGLFLMQDIAASSHVEKNVGSPLAPFLYTISCMHCMTVSLAQGGAGLGAVWGKELACEMLDDAGFKDVHVESLDHDILNYYYLAKK